MHPVQEVVRETEAVNHSPLFPTVLWLCPRHRLMAHVWGCMSGHSVFDIGSLLAPSPGGLRSDPRPLAWTGMGSIFSC